MPDFDTQTPPEQRPQPLKLRAQLLVNRLRTLLIASKPRIQLIANRLRSLLIASKRRVLLIANRVRGSLTAHRLRSLLIGGAFLFVMAAVPVGLLIYSLRGLGDQQQEAMGEASHEATHEATSVELTVSCPERSDDASNRQRRAPHGKITFLSNRDGDYDIYVMNENGGELRNLTNTSANELGAVWSPDEEKMVVVSYRLRGESLTVRLYVMNPDGTEKHFYHEVFGPEDINTIVSYLAFSPDGKKLAFAAMDESYPGEKGYYNVMHTDGTGQARLSDYPGEISGDLFWAPDSEKIAFESTRFGEPSDIYVVNADGSGLKKNLTNSSDDATFTYAGDGGYRVWSPDSEMITFFRKTGTVSSEKSVETVGKELVVKADGTGEPVEPTDVRSSCPWPTIPSASDTDLAGRFVSFQFTPTNDGGQYEFYRSAVLAASEWSSVESPDGKMTLDISGDIILLEGCVPNVPTCRRTNLTNTLAVDEYDAVWSPDGKKIAFTSPYGGNRDIHMMNIDGTGRMNLTSNAAQDGPVLRWD